MPLASERLTEEPQAPLSIGLAVRPARMLILVPLVEPIPWQRLFEHALCAQARVWGGIGSAVVPLDDDLVENELFWALADRCDADVVGLHVPAIGELEELAEDLAVEWHERTQAELREQGFAEPLIDDYLGRWRDEPLLNIELSDELQRLLVERTAVFHLHDQPEIAWTDGVRRPSWPFIDVARLASLPQPVTNATTPLGATEQLLLTVEIGRFSRSFATTLRENAIVVNDVAYANRTQWSSELFPRQREGAFPWELGELGLSWYQRGGLERGVVPFVIGDDPWDFALFYALRRWRQLAFWLPLELKNDDYFMQAIQDVLFAYARTMGGGGRVSVLSVSAPETRDEIAAALAPDAPGVLVQADEWRNLLPDQPVRLLETDRPGRFQPVLFHAGATPPLETPIPRSIGTVDPQEIRWVCDLAVDGWSPIRHRRLGALLLRAPMHGSGQVRASRAGLAYLGQRALILGGEGLESSAVRPTLHPLPLLEQLRAILPQGWTCQPSDKGMFASESTKLFGGFDRFCRVLRQPESRAVFAAFAPGSVVGLPLKDGRRYLTFADLEGVLPPEAVADDVLSALEEATALTRGLVLKCATCRWTAWYALGKISDHHRCERCRSEHRLSREGWLGTPEPVWRYALAEVLFQFLEHDGDLPLLAVFDSFANDEPLDATFELEVISTDGVKSELDIAVSSSSELWFGEATTSDSFKPRGQETARLRRLLQICEAADATGAILASSTTLRPRTRDRAASVFTDVRTSLRYIEDVPTSP